MNTVVNGTDLASGLAQLGVAAGMALEVHCALSRFGHLEGGADTVIDALIGAVGARGALVMPSFRLSPNLPLTEDDRRLGLTMKIRILPPNEKRTAMGIVSDTFRQRPDVITGEGIFRVSAWGEGAAEHSRGFQHLIDMDGYALLLGVDIYSLSTMHYVEDVLPDDIRGRFAPSAEARAKYPEDQWLIESWAPEAKPWYAIQAEAYAKGYIRDVSIGDARCMLFTVRPVIGLYRQALLERPHALYGVCCAGC